MSVVDAICNAMNKRFLAVAIWMRAVWFFFSFFVNISISSSLIWFSIQFILTDELSCCVYIHICIYSRFFFRLLLLFKEIINSFVFIIFPWFHQQQPFNCFSHYFVFFSYAHFQRLIVYIIMTKTKDKCFAVSINWILRFKEKKKPFLVLIARSFYFSVLNLMYSRDKRLKLFVDVQLSSITHFQTEQ